MGRRYLIQFEEDTLRERPLWIRVIVEFIGTFVLVTVAAGSGVINHYAGDAPVTRGRRGDRARCGRDGHDLRLGPLSGLHINPAVTLLRPRAGSSPLAWVIPYWVAQLAGAIVAAWFLQAVFGHVSAGGNYPISTPGGDWRSLVMEMVLTFILVSIILNTATGSRSIGHNAAIAVGSTVALLGLFASLISGASMNPARSPCRTSSVSTSPAGRSTSPARSLARSSPSSSLPRSADYRTKPSEKTPPKAEISRRAVHLPGKAGDAPTSSYVYDRGGSDVRSNTEHGFTRRGRCVARATDAWLTETPAE